MKKGCVMINDNIHNRNKLIVYLSIITSSFNIIPGIVIPLGLLIGLFIWSLFSSEHYMNLKIYKGFRFWFVLFVVYSVIFAIIIKVDFWNPQLYRREFKFVFPFLFLILISSLYLKESLNRTIKFIFFGISIFSILWLLFAITYPDFYNKFLYPYNGKMWESTWDGSYVYLGPFMSHSAAGGFYAVLTMLQLGALKEENERRMRSFLMIGVILSSICLYFTGSRAFLLSSTIILFLLFVINIKDMHYLKAVFNFSILLVLFINIYGLYNTGLVEMIFSKMRINFTITKDKGHLEFREEMIKDNDSNVNKSPFGKLQGIKKQKMRKYYYDNNSSSPWQDHGEFRVNGTSKTSKPSKVEKIPHIAVSARKRNIKVRLKLWEISLRDFANSPIFGVGPSRFDDDMEVISTMGGPYSKYSKIFNYKLNGVYSIKYLQLPYLRINISPFSFHTDQHAHNVYLHILAEGGIVLFSIFIFMYYNLVKRLWEIYKHTINEERGLAIGSLYAIACVAIASLFGNNLLSIIPMVTVMSVAGYLLRNKNI